MAVKFDLGLVETHLGAEGHLVEDEKCILCQAIAAEREACAKIADSETSFYFEPEYRAAALNIASAIRDRKYNP